MNSNAVRYVNCPTCQTQIPWGPHSRYRPFCSERCRLIDLGEWFGERYQVPAQLDEASIAADFKPAE